MSKTRLIFCRNGLPREETGEVEDVTDFPQRSARSVLGLEEHAADLLVDDLLGAIGIRTSLVGLQAAQVRCCLAGSVSDGSETGRRSQFLTILTPGLWPRRDRWSPSRSLPTTTRFSESGRPGRSLGVEIAYATRVPLIYGVAR